MTEAIYGAKKDIRNAENRPVTPLRGKSVNPLRSNPVNPLRRNPVNPLQRNPVNPLRRIPIDLLQHNITGIACRFAERLSLIGMPLLRSAPRTSKKYLPFTLLLVFLSAVIGMGPSNAAETEPIAGIDCGCDKTGDYSAPHRGVAPAVTLETVQEGTSPNDVYRIIVSGTTITIRKNIQGGEQVIAVNRVTGDDGWGFSPDDHRFVYHFISAGQQKVQLYDLRQRPGVRVKELSRTHIAGQTSRIRFSPNGVYLFYLSVTASAQNAVSVVDTAGVMAHEASFTHSQGVGLGGDTFHNSTWNFSRDDHDRTLVYGWTTGQNSAQIRAVNLGARDVVANIPLTTVYSSFWRFSRCADVMALHIQEAGTVSPSTPNPVRIRLIGTLDGQNLYNNSFSDIDYTVFSSDDSNHKVTIGTNVYTLVPNTASVECAVTPEPEPELAGLSISATGVTGGESTTGTVTLTLPAPPQGFYVSLTSSRSEATVPAGVTVDAGATTATFEIQTVPVTSTVSAIIKASAQGIEKSRTLAIGAPRLISVRVNVDSLVGGNPTMIYLELDGNVPSGGVEISLTHNGGEAFELPDMARIWSGRNGSVWVETRGVADPVAIEIEATLVQTRSATLHLLPAELQDIGYDFEQFSPCVLRWSDNLVIGGRRIAYRVDLNGEAPPEGAVVQLSSSDPSLISAPESVVIEGRGRYAVFQVVSTPVSITSSVPLQASYRERTIERPLTLVRPPVQYTIQEIRPEGATYVTPVGMNESGQVLIEGENNQYYLWQNGVYTRQYFPAPDGLRARIVDFNDRGQFVGVLREIIHDRGFAVWEDGVRHDRNYTRYAGAQGYYMGGTYVNNQNTFTGGTTQIFRPDASWLTEVTPPLQSDFQQEAGGINDFEEIVGTVTHDYETISTSIRQAIRVTKDGTWPLECLLTDMDAGFELHYGLAINNAGQILAESHIEDENEDITYFTWVLTPSDAPHVNLRLSKSADALSVGTGALNTVTMTILNQGPDEAQNVRLSTIIPANQRLESVDPGQNSCEEAEGTLFCEGGALASGASTRISIVTRAVVSGDSEYRSVVTSSTLETDPASNRAVAFVTVAGGDPVQQTADIGAGETGPVDLSGAGAFMEVTEGSSAAGSVSVTMYHEEPENSQDLPLVVVQASGGPAEPDSVLIERYWTLEPSGLEDMTYTLCLNISGLENVNPDYLVITKRSGSDQPWTAHNSSLRLMDNNLYLCTADLDEFSQLAIATETGTYVPPEVPPVLPAQVVAAGPADGEIMPPGEAVFRWHHSEPNVTGYRFQVSGSADFSMTVVDSLVSDTLFVWTIPDESLTWWWRVRAENEAGWGLYSAPQHFSVMPVSAETAAGLPLEFELRQNWPNPFNPSTRIRFGLPEAAEVRLEIFNVLGQRVAVLVDRRMDAGWHEVSFDAGALSSGIYLCRIQAGPAFVNTRKMMFVK